MYSGAQDKLSVLGTEGWHALLQLGGSWYAWAALPGLVLIIIGVAWRRPDERTRMPGLGDAAAITLLGLPLFAAVVTVAGSWMYARFALFSVPGAVLLMAAGIDRLWSWRRAAGLAAAAVMVACSVADLLIRPPKQPLRDAALHVRERLEPGQRVLIVGLAHQVMDAYMADLQPAWSLLHGVDLERQLEVAEPAWVIVYYPQRFTADRRAVLADRGFVLERTFPGWVDWDNGDVLVWARPR